jgi:spore maturation protein CgeB
MEKQKVVVIVGVFTPGSSNNGIARAFETLGWNVKKIPYRELAGSIGGGATSWAVINVVSTFKPDLVLFCKFDGGFSSDIITDCRRNAGQVCVWYMDSMETLNQSCKEVLEHCRNATFSICWPVVAKEMTELGVQNCYGLIEGCDETEFHPVNTDKKYESDVSYIGSKKESADKFIDALKESGIEVRCYGNGYDEYVTGDAFNSVCCSSKIILNVGTFNEGSDRIPRTLATGTLSLTSYVPGFEEYVEDGKHLVWFGDVEECVELAKKYIGNRKERERIAKGGYDLFINSLTCKHFVKRLLKIGDNVNQ